MGAVFLDRDGVINENRTDHVKSWEEFVFLPGALTALRWLNLAGFRVFIVTNQAVIGRNIVSVQAVEEIHGRLLVQVARQGGQIHDIRYCPHDADANCDCRKPRPGMLRDLAQRWGVNLSRSYMIGDAWTDIAAGRAAGTHSILVRTGRGAQHANLPEIQQHPPDYVANDLMGAVAWLMHQEQRTLVQPEDAQPLLARQVGLAPSYSVGG